MSDFASADQLKSFLDAGADFESLNHGSEMFEHFIEIEGPVVFREITGLDSEIREESLTHRYHLMGDGNGSWKVADWIDASNVPSIFREGSSEYEEGYRVSVFEVDRTGFLESEDFMFPKAYHADYSVNPLDLVEHHQALDERGRSNTYGVSNTVPEKLEKFYTDEVTGSELDLEYENLSLGETCF